MTARRAPECYSSPSLLASLPLRDGYYRAQRSEHDAANTSDGTYDLVIANGRVVDGTGSAWFYGDVAIQGDRIVKIVRRGGTLLKGKRTMDATGMVVAPGFIDIQAAGNYVTGDGRDVSKVTQGITTEIFGEAYTQAPISELSLRDMAPAGAAAARQFMGPHGFDAWLRAMAAHGISPNVGSFVGASTLRTYGMGMSMGVAPAAALDSMRAAMRRAMEDGALGLGTALIYPPGNFANTEELIEIAKAMAPYGGIYITHMRSEADQVLEAMDEAIRIGKEGGVPVEIYHLKAATSGTGRRRRRWSTRSIPRARPDSTCRRTCIRTRPVERGWPHACLRSRQPTAS